MPNTILFIHGFNSGSDSDTGRFVKEYFKDSECIIPDFDLFDVYGTLNDIREYVEDYNVDLIVGHSLGGFYTLAFPTSVNKIVINPCMYPSIEIPKLKPRTDKEHAEKDAKTTMLGGVPSVTMKEWRELEDDIYDCVDSEDAESCFGIFGKDDSLFKYKPQFDKYYHHSILVAGEHKLTKSQMNRALDLYEPAEGGSYSFALTESTKRFVESFRNILTNRMNAKDKELIRQYGDQCWKILDDGYRYIDGIAGVYSLEQLINESDFWKLIVRNGKVLAVSVYTFKRGGRKVQCASALPTPEGRDALYTIIQDDLRLKDREMWAEVSGKLETIMKKLGAQPVELSKVKMLLADKTDDMFDYGDKEIPNGKVEVIGHYSGVPEIRDEYIDDYAGAPDKNKLFGTDYHYVRKLGNQYHSKVMVGNIPHNIEDIQNKLLKKRGEKHE